MGATAGRPTALESKRRRHKFLKLLDEGATWRQAARDAGVKPDTVLGMLDDPGFADVAVSLLRERRRAA